MPDLEPRPDLDQLRRLAKELLRSAQAGEPSAVSQLTDLDAPLTLAGAQLALARSYGFASWPRLKAEVDRRRSEPPAFRLRRVRSPDELRHLWAKVIAEAGELGRPMPRHWRLLDDFERKRRWQLMVTRDDTLVGGAIGLRVVALERPARGLGLGRRLVQSVEAELLAQGEPLHTHVGGEDSGFFEALGFTRRGQFVEKGSPTGRVRTHRLARWTASSGDLDVGVELAVDRRSGRVPGLGW